MKILAVDTSCDETAVAVTEGTHVLANVIWSQASLHAEFGGVLPSLAQRQHEERIDFVIKKALGTGHLALEDIGAIAVTCGPGLAIALGVGIAKAKELAKKYHKPLIAINHMEGHLLSPLATRSLDIARDDKVRWPAVGMVISGGHTELVLIEEIGKYKIIAETVDDALGEALDKAARMLGLGYPGGALLEKMAKEGNSKAYPLPRPMAGREDQNQFSYSGLKSAMYRLVSKIKDSRFNNQLTKQEIADLAASFQNRAFEHLIRITSNVICNSPSGPSLNLREGRIRDLLVGGGVAANVDVRNRLRKMAKGLDMRVHFPYNKRLMGDNAAMIGIAAGFRAEKGLFTPVELVDRKARWRVDQEI